MTRPADPDSLSQRAFPTPEGATPMMAQFLDLRAEAPSDALLFYRMGDFYELFFDDAVRAAQALDIALTKRGEHQGEPVPMCGVPVHHAQSYLSRLIKAGFKVAVGEQMEDPTEAKKRGAKSVVRRAVTRIVTPGTLTEDDLLEARRANRIAALARLADGTRALAWADVTDGSFAAAALDSEAALEAELAALNPSELLCADEDARLAAELAPGAAITPRARAKFDASAGERRLKQRFEVHSLDAFGAFSRAEIAALGALLDYLELSQAGAPARLTPPRSEQAGAVMVIDPAARASLEIERTLQGARAGSLIEAVDRTVTAPGARLLAERLARPSMDIGQINARLDAAAFFLDNRAARLSVRERLKAAGDPARCLTRLLLGRGGPRDLAQLARALKEGERLIAGLGQTGLASAPPALTSALDALSLAARPELAALIADIARALSDEPPLLARDGGFIAPGWDPALDEARSLRDQSRRVVAGLQKTYADQTGVAGLKVKHNNVLGYFIEVTARHGDALMGDNAFIHRQTMANAVRFSTPELGELEAKIAQAGERALALELEAFEDLRTRVEDQAPAIRAAAAALAELDAAAANAEWAADAGAVRPVVDDSLVFEIEGGRHPVVEAALKRGGEARFTPNALSLDGAGQAQARLMLVTGPNMAGKSTYLRQNALIAVMAQAGLYVPAARARIGLVDRLFSRVGAADDLSRGRSTFMAEMIETAAILNQAGPRALVILDEIGRGTATFDGLSIAWAAVEHLHEVNRCRALFATHYHELTRLVDALDAAANASLRAKEWKGELVFLHEVQPGPADRSYGVEVARRAGLPPAAVARAREILDRLESDGAPAAALADLPLFSAAPPAPAPKPSAAEDRLKSIDPDGLSPKDALELIYVLKGMV
ncbi:DNA mismatch repair protein MutS [Alkalicaulis satelles]|uniref:DNA mismatch repair protein MutS n=1 Tax=Alkalicaulis satelles TaxID=2609175 RepID=A0A5M6ZHW1_9PROT|nr:DNA mismatch repair protein MutS [Alkalicaulis satelles]KAA5803675.1 DNA mismatch repair protein MutS [Alkalicaulis satelles]